MGFILFIYSGLACSSVKTPKKKYLLSNYDGKNIQLNQQSDVDSTFYYFILPYRDSVNAAMNIKIGNALTDFTRKKPESSLGNLVAESVRERASLLLKKHVDIGLVNLGGIRSDLGRGEISIRSIFELMPFENKLIIVSVTGKKLTEILNQLAKIGGEPVSGVRFKIVNGKAQDIMVSGQPIESSKKYIIATNDYLVYGGGSIPGLWDTSERMETNLLIREIILDYIKNRQNLEARMDGRIRE